MRTLSRFASKLYLSVDGKAFPLEFSHANQRSANQGADPIKLSQAVNSPTVTVCKEASSVNTMEAIVYYSRAFYLRCRIQFVDVCMKVVVNDTVSSEHLATKTRTL